MTRVFIPQAYGNATAPTGQADACGMGYLAQLFADAWMQVIGTHANGKTCHPLCTQAAQEQAQWLAANDFVPGDPHRGANGNYANQRLARTGFRVPKWWRLEDNFVESAQHAWRGDDETDEQFATRAAAKLANHDEPGKSHYNHMHFADWWHKWGFRFYGVGAALSKMDNVSWFFVCVTSVPPEEQ